jgi:hypothetical protein
MPDFDYNAWIEDAVKNAGVDSATAASLKGMFANEGLRKFAGESFLRQSDYSRRQNDLKTEKDRLLAEIEEKENNIVSFEKRLNDWQGENSGKLTKTEADLQKAVTNLDRLKVQFTAVTSKLKSGYDEYGLTLPDGIKLEPEIDDSPIVVNSTATKPQEQTVDTSNFVDRKDFLSVSNTAISLPFELNDISARHAELFGKPLANSAALRARAMKEKRSLQEVWNEEYKVDERVNAIAEEKIEQRINAEADKRAQAKISEAMRPSPASAAHHSAVLTRTFKPFTPVQAVDPAVTESQDPSRGIRAAVQAHVEGKYRATA